MGYCWWLKSCTTWDIFYSFKQWEETTSLNSCRDFSHQQYVGRLHWGLVMRWAPWKNIPLHCGSNVPPAFLAPLPEWLKMLGENHRVVGKDGKGKVVGEVERIKIYWVVATRIFVIFTPKIGKWSNLTDIFQMGWNHQPVSYKVSSYISI